MTDTTTLQQYFVSAISFDGNCSTPYADRSTDGWEFWGFIFQDENGDDRILVTEFEKTTGITHEQLTDMTVTEREEAGLWWHMDYDGAYRGRGSVTTDAGESVLIEHLLDHGAWWLTGSGRKEHSCLPIEG